jgi:hypothetical protein
MRFQFRSWLAALACFVPLVTLSVLYVSVVHAQSPAAIANAPVVASVPAAANTPVSMKLKDLDGHFPMSVPASREEWEQRAEALRLQVRSALGVHPMPPLSESAPTIHGRREMDGYSIEKIYFESLPGFYVTGSLYRPLGKEKPATGFPAVLYAHGHWDRGRFYEASPGEVRQLLATGAERFENAAINHMQAACVQLARMGCVVLQYDMIGYADSVQISFERAHLYGKDTMNPADDSDRWLLFSAKAEAYGQSIMGLQTINGVRAFEVVGDLSDVDASKIAITGASGGGTQSFITSAIEPRLAASFPAVMVSTSMQGGCTCENACGLRVGTGNIELASLTAPRPLGMTTAKDWTLKMPEDGFPELKQLYALYDKPSAVELYPGPQFPHNYNHVARVGMYGFMNRAFGMGLAEPILERDFELLRSDMLTVWDESHPKPEAGLEFERELTKRWAAMIDESFRINDGDSPEVADTKKKLLHEGWHSLASHAAALAERFDIQASDDGATIVALDGSRQSLPVELKSVAGETSSTADLLLSTHDSAAEQLAKWTSTPAYLLNVADPMGGDADKQPLVSNPRPAAAYTYGYNSPRIQRKLAVVVGMIEALHKRNEKPVRVIVSSDDLYYAAAASLILPRETLLQVVVLGDIKNSLGKFEKVDSIVHNDFLPNSLRYQGLKGLLSILDPSLMSAQ